ncbi:hypothetical protein NQ318_016435 [Aromia moschata]|uniref:Uncharacterized protein n=1 Tax=Aromia moschata TaxID=1265417 RepID=A0AAV8Z6B2_9CUCU|nr:hypothetical protein NQ318_016435 [Aromia moschata]
MCPKTNKLFCFICLVMGGNQSAWTQEGMMIFVAFMSCMTNLTFTNPYHQYETNSPLHPVGIRVRFLCTLCDAMLCHARAMLVKQTYEYLPKCSDSVLYRAMRRNASSAECERSAGEFRFIYSNETNFELAVGSLRKVVELYRALLNLRFLTNVSIKRTGQSNIPKFVPTNWKHPSERRKWNRLKVRTEEKVEMVRQVITDNPRTSNLSQLKT